MGRFFRLLTGTRRRRLSTAAVLAALSAGLIAMIASGSGSASRTIFSAADSCTSESADAAVAVTVYSGEGRAPCEALNRGVARRAGLFWRVAPTGAEPQGELICSMQKGGALMEVRQSGGRAYGDRMCAGLTAKGWRQREGPGSQLERERSAREAEAQAAAARQRAQQEAEQRAKAAAQRERSQRSRRAQAAARRRRREAASERRAAGSERQLAERRQREATPKHAQAVAKQLAAQRENRVHHQRAQRAREQARRLAQEAHELAKQESERTAERRSSEREARRAERDAHRH